MKFKKAIDVNDFLHTVEECEGEVWLESISGDKYVLKEDRVKFYKYFHEHPGVN